MFSYCILRKSELLSLWVSLSELVRLVNSVSQFHCLRPTGLTIPLPLPTGRAAFAPYEFSGNLFLQSPSPEPDFTPSLLFPSLLVRYSNKECKLRLNSRFILLNYCPSPYRSSCFTPLPTGRAVSPLSLFLLSFPEG